jgi:3-hydroxyisobutyrate dehydrogenase-like beta-hydroxyacid dehydrogenase
MTDWANSVAIPARLLNEKVGDASAVKILRSIMMKGIEALSVECLVAAHRQGLVDQVLDNVGDVDSIGFSNWVKTLTVTHLVHAKRRMEEVEKAIENLNETGMQALMSEATRQSHLRTVQAGFDAAEVADLDLKGALTMLDQRIFQK